MRPEFVTGEDIERWNDNIKKDITLPEAVAESVLVNPLLREVMYAGLWLGEQLLELNCAPEKIVRLQFTAGHLSFGRDIWEVHQEILDDYRNDRIEWEEDVARTN